MADFGRVLAVTTHTIGDQLDGQHSATATVLNLDDSSAFPEGGGTVSTPLGLLGYDKVDPDTDQMTLTYPLPSALADESRIELWDEDLGAVATETIASVVMEGSEDDGDPFDATVPHNQRGYLRDGMKDEGAGTLVEVDVAEQKVIDVPGRTPQFDGQVVWHPHSRRTTTKTIGSSSGGSVNHVRLNGWADVETDGIKFATATWTVQYPGWYEMRLSAAWEFNATGRRRIRILVNGALYDVLRVVADPDDITYMNLITQARLVEGDQVTAWAEQNSGGGLDVTASFDFYRLSV